MKKLVLIQIDGDDCEVDQLASGFSNLGNSMGYDFIIMSKNIEAISKDDFIKCVDNLKDER